VCLRGLGIAAAKIFFKAMDTQIQVSLKGTYMGIGATKTQYIVVDTPRIAVILRVISSRLVWLLNT
jgi:hypothetical protein